MSKNWEEEVGKPNTRDTRSVGWSSKDYSEYHAKLPQQEPQQEPQHVPRQQDNTNPSTAGWTSRDYIEWADNNPGKKLPQQEQEEESELSKQIQAHQDAIKKRDEEIALKRKQDEQERQKQQKQQEQLDFEKRIQTAYLYEMEKPKIGDNCLVKIGDKKQQTVKQGVIWNIEKKFLRSKKYTVRLKDDTTTTVIVDKVYSYPSGGRRRKSKKLCKMQKSRKSRRSSQSKGNSRRQRGSFSR